jgi:hypothetical protein
VSIELDWKASTARLLFSASAAGEQRPRTIVASGVRRAIFGGATSELPSAAVVRVCAPEPTADGFRLLSVEMDDQDEFLIIADAFEIVS